MKMIGLVDNIDVITHDKWCDAQDDTEPYWNDDIDCNWYLCHIVNAIKVDLILFRNNQIRNIYH